MEPIFFLLPPLDEEPFAVGPPLTICEAAMVYALRHPHGRFLSDSSVEDHEDFIRANDPDPDRRHNSWNAYCDLIQRAKGGSLPLEKRVYRRDGTLDPRHTRITFEALLELAEERGDAHERLVDLAQCYDPSADAARTTISPASRRTVPDKPKPPLPEAVLRDFLVKLGEEAAGRIPSQRECAAAVRARFPDHRVSRDRVRKACIDVYGRQRPGGRR
jgi:hypothetical protein